MRSLLAASLLAQLAAPALADDDPKKPDVPPIKVVTIERKEPVVYEKDVEPILPGKSADSLLIKLCGRTEKPNMPPKKEEPMTPEELALVKLWIDQGAK